MELGRESNPSYCRSPLLLELSIVTLDQGRSPSILLMIL